MLTNVEYQHDERQYRVVDPHTGAVEYFPSGSEGRREAMRCAVQFHDPGLYQLVRRLIEQQPHLEARAWRAAELVIRGAVKEAIDDDSLARVTGNSEYGDYLVKEHKGFIQCDCLDYMEGNAPYMGPDGQRLCKHILAAQLTRRLAYHGCNTCRRKVHAELTECPHCGYEIVAAASVIKA